MSLLDLTVRPTAPVDIIAGPVRLRPATHDDYALWTALREQSRAHLTRWEPDWTADDMAQKAFRHRVRLQNQQLRRGTGLPLLAFLQHDGRLIGGVTLSQIRRGASHSAMLGYWIGVPFVRRGLAKAAVGGVLGHAFERMGLNRVEAACQPDNEASRRLLESLRFSREGVARDYLKINGAWRDHLLYAMISRDYCAATKPAAASRREG